MRSILVVVCILMTTGIAISQSHNVFISVPRITNSLIDPLSVTITIDGSGASAGDASFSAFNDASTFYWATNNLNAKVTVQTNLPAPRYRLYIRALSPTPPAVVDPSDRLLSTTAFDFITGIGKMMGSSTIRYTGVADASAAGGFSDNHSITYTVVIF